METVHGTNVHDWLDIYGDAESEYKSPYTRILSKLAKNLRDRCGENICLTPEQIKDLGSRISEEAGKVNDVRLMPNIEGIWHNLVSLVHLKKSALNGLSDNLKNLIRNYALGEENITDYEIYIVSMIIATEISKSVKLIRGNCVGCLNATCGKRVDFNLS